MNSMTSDTESPKTKSLIFDVAEAEALMDEFGIVAPLSGLGNLQVINLSLRCLIKSNYRFSIKVGVTLSIIEFYFSARQ